MTDLESFLEIIKNNKKSPGRERVLLALPEIAYALSRNGVPPYTERETADALGNNPFLFSISEKERASYMHIKFVLTDRIVCLIKELEKQNIISFVFKYTDPYSRFTPPTDPDGTKFWEDAIKENPTNKISFLDITKDFISLEIKDAFNDYYLKNLPKKITTVKSVEKNSDIEIPEEFEVKIIGREIWINKYFLARLNTNGENMNFIAYLMANPNKKIKRVDIPKSILETIKEKRFPKLINHIGFSGELLKAFFPKRGKGWLIFTPVVSLEDLNKRVKNIDAFIKQLEFANAKNSRE